MTASLIKTDDTLEVSLSGCRGSEFTDTLAKIKEIPGRRWNSDKKVWELPVEPGAAERLLLTVNPTRDKSIDDWISESKQKTEAELVTPLPEDSDDLLIPWAKERAPWQPQEINGEPFKGLKPHQRALVANLKLKGLVGDDLGLGKSAQALSYIAECLVRYKHDYEFYRLHEKVQKRAQGEAESTESQELQKTTGDNTKDNRHKEGNSLRGLWDILAGPLHGPRSRSGADSFLYSSLAIDKAASGENQGTNGDQRVSEVRRSVSELPSPEALAGRPKLIICPKSVTGVWQREIKRWLGEEAVIAAGSSREKRKRALQEAATQGQWVITNYEQLRIVKEKVKTKAGGVKTVVRMKEPLYDEIEWLAVICDECHRIKNRKAAQTKGVYRMRAPIMLGLTGTPLMNSPDEMWSLLHWLFPKEYSSYWRFYESYVDYTEGYHGRVITGVKNPDALRFELNGRLFRRTKEQVLDLPEKQRIIVPVELNDKQAKLYFEAERSLWLEVEKAIQDQTDPTAARLLEAAETQANIYAIPNGAARTVRLRQILSTPALLGGADESAKLDAVVDAIVDNKHKPHVVFSEFVQTCSILKERLEKQGVQAVVYTGEVSSKDRTVIEDKFQKGEIDVVIGTLGAMREGITLSAADTVHFIERAWVPGWNEQAEDRVHRISQKNNVTIYIYQAQNTVDDGRVHPTNKRKEKIVGTVINKDQVKETTI